jgi:hypothetical protein
MGAAMAGRVVSSSSVLEKRVNMSAIVAHLQLSADLDPSVSALSSLQEVGLSFD